MKKQRQKGKQSRKARAGSNAPASKDRRATLRLLRNAAIGGVAIAGAGVFSVNAVRATISEQDLTKIGNGTRSIVQIHDPSCSMCTDLQREARKALRAFGDDQVNYLVANIKSDDGSAFALRHGVSHVTLLLFDAQGTLQNVLHGVRDRDELEAAFRLHLGQAG